jgi:16S rRNA (cytosine1402-N4)-methyltransferase
VTTDAATTNRFFAGQARQSSRFAGQARQSSRFAGQARQSSRFAGQARLLCSPSTRRVEVSFSARFHSARSGRNPDGTLVEGLQMSQAPHESFSHLPVMSAEITELFAPVPPGVVLDATVGGGGHSALLLEAHPHLRILGIDQDPDAVDAARRTLAPFGDRAKVVRARFDALASVVEDLGVGPLSGALFDLGVSSPQLDREERGFSYWGQSDLDMRMDPDRDLTAADVVNTFDDATLVRLLVDNGEARFARRIVRAIVAARPLTTTSQLADVVRDAIPAAARRHGGHPARRVFQAVRIAVNAELDILPGAVDDAIDALMPGGRIVVLAYHSGEDRIVKDRLRHAENGGCICPPGLPCVCGAVRTLRLLNRGARHPTAEEMTHNPRSASARLRAAERLYAAAPTGRSRRGEARS